MSKATVALGRRIQDLRQKAGLTQAQLAEKSDLSLKYIGEIERGKGNPSLSSLENLAKALDISLTEMFIYGHEQLSAREIKTNIKLLVDDADDEKCRMIYRLILVVLDKNLPAM